VLRGRLARVYNEALSQWPVTAQPAKVTPFAGGNEGTAQSAKVTPFAGGNEGTVRRGTAQSAKVTPFAGGNEGTVRKSAAGDFFQ
jgi:hypothetical protein